jgi:uncharacterized protein YceK
MSAAARGDSYAQEWIGCESGVSKALLPAGCLVDLPFSLALDTLLLPADLLTKGER